jgi:hypothetical protein
MPANYAASKVTAGETSNATKLNAFIQAVQDAQNATGDTSKMGWAAGAILALSQLQQSGATTGQVPTWNGSTWAPAAPASIPADLAYVTFGTVSISATTAASANTVVTATAFTADGTSSYWVEFYCGSVQPDTGGRGIQFDLWEASTDGGKLGWVRVIISGGATNTVAMPVLLRKKVTPSGGTRTYSVRAYVTDGAAGSSIVDGTQGPGFIRIWKA